MQMTLPTNTMRGPCRSTIRPSRGEMSAEAIELRLDPTTIVLRDHSRSADIAGRKMLKVKPFVVAWEVGGRDCVTTILADVTKAEDAERVVRQTITQMDGFHILINNAGINPLITPSPPSPLFSQIPIDAWTRTMAVNINGPFFMA